MLNIRQIAWVIALAGMGTSSIFASTVVFNDFGPGSSYESGTGWTVAGSSSSAGMYYASAMPFTPSGDFNLAQIDIALSYISGDESFVVDLDSDNGGTPGSVLASWTLTSGLPSFGSCCSVNTLTPTSTVSLSDGVQYWLVASPSDPGGTAWGAWNFNNTGATGNVLYQTSPGGAFTPPGGNTLGAFDVLGNSPVPEPASAGMTLGAALFGGLLWRRRCGAARR